MLGFGNEKLGSVSLEELSDEAISTGRALSGPRLLRCARNDGFTPFHPGRVGRDKFAIPYRLVICNERSEEAISIAVTASVGCCENRQGGSFC
jgi:hypothetical protein